jgi:hypothetical protein
MSYPDLEQFDWAITPEDSLVTEMTRIAEALERMLVGTMACVALLTLIAVCEVVRLGIF